jgi:hypothetical protein
MSAMSETITRITDEVYKKYDKNNNGYLEKS